MTSLMLTFGTAPADPGAVADPADFVKADVTVCSP